MIDDRELLGVETPGELVAGLELIQRPGEIPFEDSQDVRAPTGVTLEELRAASGGSSIAVVERSTPTTWSPCAASRRV